MNSSMTDLMTKQLSSYEDVASEYYDASRHPTCRDLRQLSAEFLVPLLRAGLPPIGSLVETGPGMSILAPEAAAANALSRVTLVDSSPAMLAYSNKWVTRGAHGVVSSAEVTGLPSESASLIVSSLGDPYNGPGFWREVARLLTPEGKCLFTIPSFEWSSSFRSGGERQVAEFLRGDGVRLLMPSHVWSEEEQVQMIEAAGLHVKNRVSYGTEMLKTQPAPKLLCVKRGTPVLAAYVVTASH
jgi:SAM-dependent methyltransferase